MAVERGSREAGAVQDPCRTDGAPCYAASRHGDDVRGRIDTSGFAAVSRRPWVRDSRYTEVWVRDDDSLPECWRLHALEGP
jgi:hypothetical protein